MRTLTTIDAIRAALATPRKDARIGLVPTMGNLHDGHIALVAACEARCDISIVSIYVNPLQFGPHEDFDRYPRTPDEDLARLASAGTDFVFMPSDGELYPDGRVAQTHVHVPFLSGFLCGAARPGHFDGVATVVLKLLNIVAPHYAFFGEKDYQQLTLLRSLVRHLNVPVEIVGVPTVRADDGLALSSRNQYLSAEERAAAPALYRTIRAIADSLAGGRRDFSALEQEGMQALARAGFRPDYVAIRHAETLRLPSADDPFRVLAAGHLGRARLIDNVGVPGR
jgi:pantoate--beta-alanine ligase